MDVDDLTAALAALKDLDADDLNGTQWDKVQAKITEVTEAIEDATADNALAEAVKKAQAAYDEVIDATSAPWPEGAAEAAKNAVAAKLAEMSKGELDALKPAKNDNIWNTVIVPIVEEMQADDAKAQKTEAVKAAVEGVKNVDAATGDAKTVRTAIAVAVQAAGNAAGNGSFDYTVDLGDSFAAIDAGSIATINCTVTVTGADINDVTANLTVTVEVA